MTDAPRYPTAPGPGGPEQGIPLPRLALAMSLLVSPVGLVLGVVARRRVRRTGEDGAGTALAAIVVGAALTAAYLLLVAALVVLLVLVRDQAGALPPGLGGG
ncbi:MAG: DUF4190 domain-containing protein [Mycobacteriales bacterium]